MYWALWVENMSKKFYTIHMLRQASG